jgi:hypothetical protein
MGIETISRDWGVSPSIVRVTTTDNLATITTAGYITNQEQDINDINHGDFEWADGDLIAIDYNGGEDYFTRDAVNNTFILNSIPAGSIPLTNGHILVGNALNLATDVAASGDVALSNTGVITIQNNAVTTAKILNGNVTLPKLSAGILPSHVIKFGGKLTTVAGLSVENFAIAGIIGATDLPFVEMSDQGTNTVSILEVNVGDNVLTVTFSGDPGNDCVFFYQIIRPAS